ncbi:FMN reductase MsuE [Arthrobacter crystallopoietes BAB-32]|uniref:FMN reductase MsuE n=1 Tax=Arthrobacter crystallopoietes BAB-32 TaxID=1246476 RepID=N1V429_9MICC|nr:FMN reductase [Arthrobacter crystallopoietes]EMY34802.1 FMN reductase MsuE [Arthrobacter crystallopoietes BAB-32]
MSERKIVVLSAGLGVPSSSRMLADQLAKSAAKRLALTEERAVIETFELREYAVDIANNMVTGYAGPKLAAMIEAVTSADALIAVTPVFSASYSGLFKSFFDVIDKDSLAGKPILVGATGGTARHSLALDYAIRPLFSYLRARTTQTVVFAAPEDWGSGEGTGSSIERRSDRAAAELVALIQGSSAPETGRGGVESLSFEEILANVGH